MTTIPPTTQADLQTSVIGVQSQFPSEIIGVPVTDPLLTWQVISAHSDATQIAFEISSIDSTGKIFMSIPRVAKACIKTNNE